MHIIAKRHDTRRPDNNRGGNKTQLEDGETVVPQIIKERPLKTGLGLILPTVTLLICAPLSKWSFTVAPRGFVLRKKFRQVRAAVQNLFMTTKGANGSQFGRNEEMWGSVLAAPSRHHGFMELR